ncbi:hypothetical protein KY290_009147 [Solanum tuberosum]|uniref:F-box domain-containing protein n=1 Tax=Solanum tuberosum TaxID=4113 RepID=A0ABQ7WBV7_SOLTU|nr:hypothetical protein KY290_009147 [Solanum tuberosum]
MMEAMAPWSDLPRELVERISKFVNSHIDILRIRAVCSSWRSAFSPNFKIPKPQFPIKLPYKLPFPHQPMFWTTDLKSHCCLIESTVYLFQLPHPPHTGWLVKILKTAYEGVKILNPLTNRVIDDLPDEKLNLLDLRVSQGLSSSIFNGWGTKKRLVESGGELFLVDMFLDTDVKTEVHGSQPSWNCPKEIKVYRLDEEQHEWIAVHTLGDQIFFAGDDCCFSVSSSDFGDQCRGNCIYYVNGGITVNMRISPPKYYAFGFEDYLVYGLSKEVKLRYKGLHGHHTGIFSLQDGKLGSLLSFLEYADIFWPPPSWLFTEDDQAASKKFSRFVIDDRHGTNRDTYLVLAHYLCHAFRQTLGYVAYCLQDSITNMIIT